MTTAHLPGALPEPAYDGERAPVTITSNMGKVNYSLTMEAMGTDDVYLHGTVTYRGNEYRVSHEHTSIAGEAKGFEYGRPGEDGNAYGLATKDYARRNFFKPQAPATYVEPMLDAVREAVTTYVREFSDHVRAGIRRDANNDAHRYAGDYNRKAAELRELLAKYEGALAIVAEHEAPADA